MIKPYKGRACTIGQRVEVYRNLNRGGFSVRDKKTKLVVGHTDHLDLVDCVPVIQRAAQQRAKSAGVRNVHAWIEGSVSTPARIGAIWYKVQYDPFGCGDFTVYGRPFVGAHLMVFTHGKAFTHQGGAEYGR